MWRVRKAFWNWLLTFKYRFQDIGGVVIQAIR